MTERLTVGVAARLSRYLQVLTQARKMGKERISSQEIAEYTNINATQIRRDLSAFGKFGKRGVGYRTDALLDEIRLILRTQGQHNIALVGAGRLGSAIASSPIFAEHGITVAAVLDNDPDKIGERVGDLMISSIADIGEIARERNIIVGVIAVPADSAQNAADALIGAGAKIIFNYSEALARRACGRQRPHVESSGRPALRALLPPGLPPRPSAARPRAICQAMGDVTSPTGKRCLVRSVRPTPDDASSSLYLARSGRLRRARSPPASASAEPRER